MLHVLIHHYKVCKSDHIRSNQLLTKIAKCMESAAFFRHCRYLCVARDAVFWFRNFKKSFFGITELQEVLIERLALL